MGGGASMTKPCQGEGARGGRAPSRAKPGSFRYTNIFMHEKLMYRCAIHENKTKISSMVL